MKSFRFNPLSAMMLLFVACVLLAVGCATNHDGENVSERPWNDTQGWQGGLPSGLNEGR